MTWWQDCLTFLKRLEDNELSTEMNYIAEELND